MMPGLVIGLGLLLMIAGGVLAWRCCRLLLIGGRAVGIVEDLIETPIVILERGVARPEVTLRPRVAFTLPDGKRIVFRHFRGARPAAYAVGAQVPVRYDRAHPTVAEIEEPDRPWTASRVMIAVGLVLALTGLAGLLL